jgi:C1A family cysteine protease
MPSLFPSPLAVNAYKKALACNGHIAAISENWGHAFLIIGWDDNFSADGYKGAWIIKNSWGANWLASGGLWSAGPGYGYIPYSGHPYSNLYGYFVTGLA